MAMMLVAVVMVTGAVGASAQADPIVGCQNRYTGQLRIINSAANCSSSEHRLEFQSYSGAVGAQQDINALIAVVQGIVGCFQGNTFQFLNVTLYNPVGVINCLLALDLPKLPD